MSQPIWYDSTEAGAPALTATPGSLIEVLRACLVNGFNAKGVTSISVAAGVATVTAAAHGFTTTAGKLVQIAGAAEAGLNGNKQPLTASTNTFTFDASGVPDGTYSGTISARRAPLGWAEAFTDGTRSLFSRLAPESTAMMLRVDNSDVAPAASGNARVVMVEAATGLDAYTDASPTAAQASGGLRWEYRNTAGTKNWALWGDDRFFYVALPWNGTTGYYLHYFGDLEPTFQPDAYCCVLAGAQSLTTANAYDSTSTAGVAVGSAPTSVSTVVARAENQLTKAQAAGVMALSQPNRPIGDSASGQTRTDFVQVVDSVMLLDATSVRGVLPGMAAPLGRRPFSAAAHFSVHAIDGSDRRYSSVLNYTGTGATSYAGNVLIDVSGPWR